MLTFTYDSGGNQLTAATSGAAGQPAVTLTSTYDDNHNRTSLSDSLSSAGVISYSYDAANRMTSIVAEFGTAYAQVTFGYDAADRLTSIYRSTTDIGGGGGGPLFHGGGGGIHPDGGGSGGPTPKVITTTITYDADGDVTSISHQVSGGATLATFTYGYNAAEETTAESDDGSAVSYTYDSGGQLTDVGGAYAATYSYDANGNRTMTGYSTADGNEMTASPGYTYTYDAEGNMTGETQTSNGDVTTFAYDYRNRLVGATEKNSGGHDPQAGDVHLRRAGSADRLTRRSAARRRPGRSTTGRTPTPTSAARALSRIATSTARRSTRSWRGWTRAGRRRGI